MKLSVIIAISQNNVIGKGDQLPWHLSADLKRFKAITTGHPIIMGRKTHESIGKVLPGRVNIIITSNRTYKVEGAVVVHSIEQAITEAQSHDQDEAFVIGGAAIIKEGLKHCQKIYLTKVLSNVEGDVFLNLELSPSVWKTLSIEQHPADEKNDHAIEFIDLERI